MTGIIFQAVYAKGHVAQGISKVRGRLFHSINRDLDAWLLGYTTLHTST